MPWPFAPGPAPLLIRLHLVAPLVRYLLRLKIVKVDHLPVSLGLKVFDVFDASSELFFFCCCWFLWVRTLQQVFGHGFRLWLSSFSGWELSPLQLPQLWAWCWVGAGFGSVNFPIVFGFSICDWQLPPAVFQFPLDVSVLFPLASDGFLLFFSLFY